MEEAVTERYLEFDHNRKLLEAEEAVSGELDDLAALVRRHTRGARKSDPEETS
jgi:hypothetical protein